MHIHNLNTLPGLTIHHVGRSTQIHGPLDSRSPTKMGEAQAFLTSWNTKLAFSVWWCLLLWLTVKLGLGRSWCKDEPGSVHSGILIHLQPQTGGAIRGAQPCLRSSDGCQTSPSSSLCFWKKEKEKKRGGGCVNFVVICISLSPPLWEFKQWAKTLHNSGSES